VNVLHDNLRTISYSLIYKTSVEWKTVYEGEHFLQEASTS